MTFTADTDSPGPGGWESGTRQGPRGWGSGLFLVSGLWLLAKSSRRGGEGLVAPPPRALVPS